MQRNGSILVGIMLAAGGFAATATSAAASDAGIAVYTWTDANGVTHFSDTPHRTGASKKLVLPTPPPPNRTAIAAQRAWVRQLNRNSKKELARQAAAHRRAERQAQASARQRQSERQEVVQYVPALYPLGYRHRYRHGHRHEKRAEHLPSARFPFNALPSSFPDPLASSFPPGLPSSFPEEQSPPPRRR